MKERDKRKREKKREMRKRDKWEWVSKRKG